MTPQFDLFAAGTASEFFQFARLQAMSEWWHWLVLVTVCTAILVYIVTMYRRDSVELSRGMTWVLVALRVFALLGVLFFFLDLEKRTERKLVKNSRVLLLVDTSQSMGLTDQERTDAGNGNTRSGEVIEELSQGPLLNDLRKKHDVVVYRFDQTSRPEEVAAYTKAASAEDGEEAFSPLAAYRRSLGEARVLAVIAGAFLFAGAFSLAVFFLVVRSRSGAEGGAWWLPGGVFAVIVGIVVLAIGNLRNPDVGLTTMLGLSDERPADELAQEDGTGNSDGTESDAEKEIDWATELAARGLQTRMGDALRYLVNKERGGPAAGIVVFSDGRENEGVEYTLAARLAELAEIPVYPIGLGSDRRPTNVRVVDLEAPERVYPGDRFTITGYVQANGLPGRTVEVVLTSTPAGAADGEEAVTIEQEDHINLGEEGEIVGIKFDITPEESGRRTYRLAVTAPSGDLNELDDSKTANVEVVDRKTRVLLMAGGPSREFRFLRNLLFRDRETTVDVLLQSGQAGMSQESDNLLFDFPAIAEDLFEYDCLLAFDPDWTSLDLLQIKALEEWVAEKAGGLVVVAGPVHTPQWADVRRGDTRFNTIRSLYPVVLFSSGSATLGLGRFGGVDSWPIEFTREGREAEFLWLEDNALGSEAAWASFDGVFGYYAVKDPKPGARVYSRFGDPNTSLDDQLPIYMAGHFYGAGRVFFQASGEMWRLRAMDEAYFETYYTKLVRWVSQGRLLQDSARGVLLLDKDRCLLGETVGIQAILTDVQNRPLSDPEVTAHLIQPDDKRVPLTLKSVQGGAREGTYTGQFTAVMEGDWRVELRPPQGEIDEYLTREVRVRIEDLEIQQPERNDPLLLDLARTTGGTYYVGIDAAAGRTTGQPPLANVLEAQDQVAFLPGLPDSDFERQLMAWLMAVICGALGFEWLLRRLSRLA